MPIKRVINRNINDVLVRVRIKGHRVLSRVLNSIKV